MKPLISYYESYTLLKWKNLCSRIVPTIFVRFSLFLSPLFTYSWQYFFCLERTTETLFCAFSFSLLCFCLSFFFTQYWRECNCNRRHWEEKRNKKTKHTDDKCSLQTLILFLFLLFPHIVAVHFLCLCVFFFFHVGQPMTLWSEGERERVSETVENDARGRCFVNVFAILWLYFQLLQVLFCR